MYRLLAAALCCSATGAPAQPSYGVTPAGHSIHYVTIRRWGRSGFGFTIHTSTSTISTVAPMTPAAEAGIQPGDRVLGVPGTSADWVKTLTSNYRTVLAIAREPPLDGTWVSSKGRFTFTQITSGMKARFTDRSIDPSARTFVSAGLPGQKCRSNSGAGARTGPPLGFSSLEGGWCADHGMWLRWVGPALELCIHSTTRDEDALPPLDHTAWDAPEAPPRPPACKQRAFAFRTTLSSATLVPGQDGVVDLGGKVGHLSSMNLVLLYVMHGDKFADHEEASFFSSLSKTVKLRQPKVTFARADASRGATKLFLAGLGTVSAPALVLVRWGGGVVYSGENEVEAVMTWLVDMQVKRVARPGSAPPPTDVHPLLGMYGAQDEGSVYTVIHPPAEVEDPLETEVHIGEPHNGYVGGAPEAQGVYLIADVGGVAHPVSRDLAASHFRLLAERTPWASSYVIAPPTVPRAADTAPAPPPFPNRPYGRPDAAALAAARISLVRIGGIEAVRAWYRGDVTNIPRLRAFAAGQRHNRLFLGTAVLHQPAPHVTLYSPRVWTESMYTRAVSQHALGWASRGVSYGVVPLSNTYGAIQADVQGLPRHLREQETLVLWEETSRGGFAGPEAGDAPLAVEELEAFVRSWEDGELQAWPQTSYDAMNEENSADLTVGISHNATVERDVYTLMVYLPSSAALNLHRQLKPDFEEELTARLPGGAEVDVQFMVTSVNEGAPTAAEAPDVLAVVAAVKPEADGMYTRVPGATLRGYPVWESASRGGQMLYTDSTGRWIVGILTEVKNEVCWVCSAQPHNGTAPHAVTSWLYYDPHHVPGHDPWSPSRELKVIEGTPMIHLWHRGANLGSCPTPRATRPPSIGACSAPTFSSASIRRAVRCVLNAAGL